MLLLAQWKQWATAGPECFIFCMSLRKSSLLCCSFGLCCFFFFKFQALRVLGSRPLRKQGKHAF